MKQQENEETQYQYFLQGIVAQVGSLTPENTYVQVRKIRKNNGCSAEGLEIRDSRSGLSPTVYLMPYFREYKEGADIRELAGKIYAAYGEKRTRLDLAPGFFSSYSNLSGSVAYKIVNYKANRDVLEEIPHQRILDLAVVYYCLIDSEEYFTSFVIRNQNLTNWGIPQEKLFREAAVNAPKLLPPKISPLRRVLLDMMREQTDVAEDDTTDEKYKGDLYQKDGEVQTAWDAGGPEIYVLTNETKVQGAACIFYENVLQDFADKTGSDLIIIPSSVHEVLLLPTRSFTGYSSGKCSADVRRELDEMVRSVNEKEVSPDEVLSDHVYFYEREKGRLTM
ncbi:MAG: DUF5688 family protein [Lachnospiraceae bacterium]|jgi:hypothetical protein